VLKRTLAPLIRGWPAMCLTLFHAASAAEPPFRQDFQTWTNITANGSFGLLDPGLGKFRFWLEGQGRFGNDSTTLSQGILRPGLGYSLADNLSVWLGYAVIPTMEPFSAVSFNENRIWQQVLWTPQTAIGPITSRTRFEQRFTRAPDVSYRLRQMVRLAYPLDFAPGFMLVGWEELFLNINSTGAITAGFDQNRVFLGVGYAIDENLRTEIGYMNQYIYRDTTEDLMTHVLSLSLFLNY
jgi:hypothetical protein